MKKKTKSWSVAEIRYVIKLRIRTKMHRAIIMPSIIVDRPGWVSTILAAARAVIIIKKNYRYCLFVSVFKIK